ncbi:TPA: EpsG family protein [Yersinia enterocolitica]
MNFLSVENYVLVTDGVLPKYLFLIITFYIFCMIVLINEVNSKVSSLILFFYLFILSCFFSLNGPDKGSYSYFYTYLVNFSDIFSTLNTVDSPLYYILMVSVKSLGASYEMFFIFQNILICLALLFLCLKIKNGIYVVFWLWFTHLLIPFSVRSHLLLFSVPLLYYISNKWGGGIVALLSVALHPLMAIFPLVYFYRNKLSLIKYLVIAGAVLLIFFDYFYNKFSSYILDSKSYFNDSSAFYISPIFEFIEFTIFYNALKKSSISISFNTKLLLILPIFVSLLSIYLPTLGRFGFAFDLMYVLVLLNYNLKISKSMWLLLCLIAFVRFAKNYIMQEYYII